MALIIQIVALTILFISIIKSESISLGNQMTLSNEINELENIVLHLGDSDEKLKKRLDGLLSEVTKLNNEKSLLMTDHPRGRRSTGSSPSIGFSATMTAHNENMNLQDTVKFQNLITNDGNGYDHIGGIFHAPVPGLYFFNVVILSHAGEDMETEIVKNGDGVVRTYSGDSTTWNAGTQSTVLQLETGDQVWVRILNAVPSVNNGNIRIFGSGFSSFSGFLIST